MYQGICNRKKVATICAARRGFTLIELLVVVLIIGILAAIAVPQYQKTVELVYLAEAKTFLHTATTAIDAYLMSNGGYPQPPWCGGCWNVDFMGSNHGGQLVLSIDLQKGLDCKVSASAACASKYFIYDAYCVATYCSITIDRHTGKDLYIPFPSRRYKITARKTVSSNRWTYACGNYASNFEKKICEKFLQSL